MRLPVVSLLIMALCALAFGWSWLLPDNPLGPSREQSTQVFVYWQQRPYLKFSAPFERQLADQQLTRQAAQLRAQWLADHGEPDEELARAEQERFDQLQLELLEARLHTVVYRWSLVPARGLAQTGWLTHLFVHFGWLHLIFNLLFLYLVGLMLEDLWGPAWFAGFYLVGGLVAAACHFALAAGSEVPMGGASGAIAACMGAFAVRFARKKVSFLYFAWVVLRPKFGVASVAAWVAALAWFLNELYAFVAGDSPGVAVAAHLGGFAFGAAVAAGLKVTGVDKRFAATSEQDSGPLAPSIHPEVDSGRVAFRQGRYPEARAHFERALAADPADFDADWEIVKLDLAEQRLPAALERLERSLLHLLKEHRDEQATAAMVSVWNGLEVATLSPRFCFSMARAFEPSAPDFAELLYERAGADLTLVGAKALVRAAELRLQGNEARWLARGHLQAARARGHLELSAHIDELLVRCPEAPAPIEPSGLELDRPDPVSPEVKRPRVVDVAVSALSSTGFEAASSSGQRRQVLFSQVVGVAAALVPVTRGGHTKAVLLVDFVLAWATAHAPTTVVRFDSEQSGTEVSRQFGTGGTAREVYGRLLTHVLEVSRARAVPDAATLSTGAFARYDSVSAFELATYGVAR